MICELCKKDFKDDLNSFRSHLKGHKITSKEYADKYLGQHQQYCKICGKPTEYAGFVKGYRTYCSKGCMDKDHDMWKKANAKTQASVLKKYGVKNAMQNTGIKTRAVELGKKAVEEKYNVKNVFQLESVKNKAKQTMLSKTGYENVMSSPEGYADWKKKFSEKHGEGIVNPGQLESTRELNTVHNCMSDPEVAKRSLETRMKIYKQASELCGEENCKRRTEETIAYCKEYLDKVDCEYISYRVQYYENRNAAFIKFRCKKCGTVSEIQKTSVIEDRAKKGFTPCRKCLPRQTAKSLEEDEFANAIQSILPANLTIERNVRILDGKEIDIYIPEKKLGIEYNGEYFHTLKFHPKDYHREKYLTARNAGITLLQFYTADVMNGYSDALDVISERIGKPFPNPYCLNSILTKDGNTFITIGATEYVLSAPEHELRRVSELGTVASMKSAVKIAMDMLKLNYVHALINLDIETPELYGCQEPAYIVNTVKTKTDPEITEELYGSGLAAIELKEDML